MKRRKIITFEPSGPVASILEAALRGKSRGARTKLIESAIVEQHRKQFPKLAARYDVLREESLVDEGVAS